MADDADRTTSDHVLSTAPGRAAPIALSRRLRWGLAAAVAVQLVVLYLPRGVAGPTILPGLDKVVHVAVFLVPVLLALLAGLSARAVAGLFAAHAVLSEVVQATVLPERSGDVWDVVADFGGVLLGWLMWRHRRRDPGVTRLHGATTIRRRRR